MTTELRKISVGDFIFRVLSGVAIGIVVGLVPNAILGEIFKALMHHHPIFATLLHVVQALQFTVPALVGALIAIKFNMTPLAIAVVSSAAYVGSGAAQFKNGAWIIAGIGDLINTMITALQFYLFYLLKTCRKYGIDCLSNNCWRSLYNWCAHPTICTYYKYCDW